MDNGKHISYRDRLVASIKDAGQDLIDRAEEMVAPGTEYITNFNITINFEQGRDSIPLIEWSTEVLSKNTHRRYLNGD